MREEVMSATGSLGVGMPDARLRSARPRVVGAIVVLLGAAAGGYVAVRSNLFVQNVSARFTRSDVHRGLNDLRIVGPYGSHCIVYHVEVGHGGKVHVGGGSMCELPLFGALIRSTNYYPDSGRIEGIPLEQHVKVSNAFSRAAALYRPQGADQEKRVGTYLLVTRDRSWFGRVHKEAPAVLP